jgi:hypothetical protein
VKLAASIVLGLLVLGAAWHGCDDSRARPGKPRAAIPTGDAAAVAPDAMCVTLGKVEPLGGSRFRVSEAKVRGIGVRTFGRSAELRFVYRGASAEVSRLGSGKVLHQLGLKLEAQDGCNLVYVMWRLETGVEALVKKNPGQSVHSECGNRGYRKLKPEVSRPPPALEPGAAHRLSAELVGTRLVARVDGEVVLEADAGELGFSGPAGFRTDNVQADLELHARPSDAAAPCTRGGD